MSDETTEGCALGLFALLLLIALLCLASCTAPDPQRIVRIVHSIRGCEVITADGMHTLYEIPPNGESCTHDIE